MTNKSRILNPYVLLCTIGMLTLFSCKEDCLIDCNENAYCKDMECHCDDPEMFKFGNSDTENINRINCQYRESTETSRSFRTVVDEHNCRCVPDFIASFAGCTGGGSGPIIIGNCNFLAIYKDKDTEDIYRRGVGPGSGLLPIGEGGQDEFEVKFRFRDDVQYVCPELDYPIDYVDFSGHANKAIDTLFLTMTIVPADDREIEDICDFKMVLIPERN